ncbi:DEAD/DEAH box helicase [Paenibacillus eucommiae]|uniref:Superfamily II DNA/RNA helicase n=1 Tax=Paenibacillus eucommiae TaxID=1355755 RepID=A0ABS4J3G4_9BACL|nr:DEAD/DEAH box helicase [Paenibacillus eucommiae]MBP1993359.1 superfamily II DNA/RNA helicase [Paenibacillus eucommiae]
MSKSFEELLVDRKYIDRLQEKGVDQPTPIQLEAIPAIAEGKDTIVQSQTGTGKTLAYLLPALQRIDAQQKKVQVLVLVPTRELGMQIIQETERLIEGGPIRAQALIGGAAITRQLDKLKLHPHIVVGTPGRIIELVKLKKLSLHHIEMVIVDEVDQVFELGSLNEVETLLKGMLKSRQVVFVSATIPAKIAEAARIWMNEPVVIRINPEQLTAETLEHFYFVSDERDKIDTLRKLVRLINPTSAIVFINATADISEVVGKLQYVGLSVEALYGEAGKQERAKVMADFREGKFQLLLATDIAARGLDIEGVTHVFHLDPALNAEHYLHRVGRTGRMGRKGTAISIITRKELFILDKFERALGITIAPKAMYDGRVVDPADDRSASARRDRKAAASRPAGGDVQASARGRADAGAARVSAVSGAPAARSASAEAAGEAVRGSAAVAKPAAVAGAAASAAAAGAGGAGGASAGKREAGKKPGQSKAARERERKNKGAPKWLKAKREQE